MTLNGKRSGPGRPKGALNRRSREVLERVEATGKTPLEVLLEAMRYHYGKWEKAKVKNPNDAEISLAVAAGFAKDCAPFLHPRLQTSVVTMPGLIPLDAIREILDEDDTPFS